MWYNGLNQKIILLVPHVTREDTHARSARSNGQLALLLRYLFAPSTGELPPPPLPPNTYNHTHPPRVNRRCCCLFACTHASKQDIHIHAGIAADRQALASHGERARERWVYSAKRNRSGSTAEVCTLKCTYPSREKQQDPQVRLCLVLDNAARHSSELGLAEHGL